MKKLWTLVIGLVILISVHSEVFAANGDIIGKIYSTDIKAYINGVCVDSYNIGGRTAVVIEDVLSEHKHMYIYDNSSRTLKFFSLNPVYLTEGQVQNSQKSGMITGNVYETDIKTSVYDVIIPTYNIGGKTAVAIEDLGYDKIFSPIGGRYIWNEEERTISLEFLYESAKNLSNDKNIIITANDDMTEMTAVFEEALHCGGNQEHFKFPDYITDNSEIEIVLPVKAEEEVIGYYFRRPSKENKFTAFTYYYAEKVSEAEKVFIPDPHKTREGIISHFLSYHSVGEPRERFDTEDYSFIYISVAGTSWTSYNLVQVWDDGSYVDYGKEINTRNRSPKNLTVDRENEKVTFRYVDRYNSDWFTDYEIDLKAGKINAYNNLETDIGVGTTDGQPAEAEQVESRNEQYEYKLVSGEEQMRVKGFFVHEYYYADMLPLAETFEFLNIRYSFENDILTIDTSEAKPFSFERTENRVDILGENPIDYLHVKNVMLNGKETEITYQYISGHFDGTQYGRSKAKPYVCNGKVYINTSFISALYET